MPRRCRRQGRVGPMTEKTPPGAPLPRARLPAASRASHPAQLPGSRVQVPRVEFPRGYRRCPLLSWFQLFLRLWPVSSRRRRPSLSQQILLLRPPPSLPRRGVLPDLGSSWVVRHSTFSRSADAGQRRNAAIQRAATILKAHDSVPSNWNPFLASFSRKSLAAFRPTSARSSPEAPHP